LCLSTAFPANSWFSRFFAHFPDTNRASGGQILAVTSLQRIAKGIRMVWRFAQIILRVL
jgi:hypothetical protein